MSSISHSMPLLSRRRHHAWSGWIFDVTPESLTAFGALPEADRESLVLLHRRGRLERHSTSSPLRMLREEQEWTLAQVAAIPELTMAMARRAAHGTSCGSEWGDAIADEMSAWVDRLLSRDVDDGPLHKTKL